MSDAGQLSFLPVTAERLGDLRRFSEAFGKFRYCSCMRWRLSSSEFAGTDASERARRLGQLVQRSLPVGMLAYQGDEPIGWCSIAPRETYVAVERSRKILSSGEAGTWSAAATDSQTSPCPTERVT